MDNDKKVLKFPPIKEQREKQIAMDDIADRLILGVTDKAFLTINGGFMEMRNEMNHPIGSYPLHKFDEYLLRHSCVAEAQVNLLTAALVKAGIKVSDILSEENISNHLLKHYVRSD